MSRRRIRLGLWAPISLLLVGALPTWGFIEKLTHLGDIVADSDHIFVAKIESVDADRPAAVLRHRHDLKGQNPYQRIPINLTGDKEKHTPQLLKRIAPNLPVIVFITELDKKRLGLVYTNGTWFQILGEADGPNTRWAFTHVEIYLRRTFKGTTAEMQEVLADALAGKKKPPPANPKEVPGFGPEIEPQPGKNPQNFKGQAAPDTLLGVIALPFLMPIAALLQLLFPGLLRDQWRQYQIAVSILLTQSTLIFTHWAVCTWVVANPAEHWWLTPASLWTAIVGLSVIGVVVALVRHFRAEPLPLKPPRRVEYLALGALVVAGLGWAAYQWWTDDTPFRDEMAVVTAAAFLATLHLLYRRLRHHVEVEQRAVLTTELIFLGSLVLVGSGLGMYLHRPEKTNLDAGAVTVEWNTFRGNGQRTGTLDAHDPGPTKPAVLWTFAHGERKGRVSFHSSPTVVDGLVYVGAMHEIQSLAQGLLYCINAADGKQVGDRPLKAGERLWRFAAEGSLKPVFSSPTIHSGRIYVGEGYHQDTQCRLFCLDARNGDNVLWSKRTGSHVESSPAVHGERVYFGAGDDGLLCVAADQLEDAADGSKSPKTLWQVPNVHVDASPLVVGGRVFFGSIIGDRHQALFALVADAHTGQVLWRTPAPMPLLASPAHANGRVFFGLGNGKLGRDADQPAGALWCLDAATGRRLWEYPVGNNVLGTPALDRDHVYFGSCDGWFYCIRQADGVLAWKANLKNAIAAAPVVAGGKAYVLTTTGVLVCFSNDGRELWRLSDLADGIADAYSSPTLAHGRLYVALDGKVVCVGDR